MDLERRAIISPRKLPGAHSLIFTQWVGTRGRFFFASGLMLLWSASTGCTFDPFLPSNPSAGDSFANAGKLTLDDAGATTISGSITSNKPAVYDLGAVSRGDRVIVTVDPAVGSGLDPVIGLFDENEEVFGLNDDLDTSQGMLGSAIDDYVTVAGEHFYLAISKFFFDTEGGRFEGTVEIQRGGTVPTPDAQTLLLNFAGGKITIPSEGEFDVDPFDAADIDPAYTGKTSVIKAGIIAVVKDRYKDTGLEIVVSDDNPVLDACTYSTLYFGAASSTKFGVAQDVDQGNRGRCDDAIVFTIDFDKPFATQPSANGIAVAIGQVAVHEAGHLLGLNHVADITDLMDTTGTASTLLAEQTFKSSVLSDTIFPIGKQNGRSILQRVVPK